MMEPVTKEESKIIGKDLKLDNAILDELRAAFVHLTKAKKLATRANGRKYCTVNEVLNDAELYHHDNGLEDGDLLDQAMGYVEILGAELYARNETPGPFVEGIGIWNVEKPTEAQEEVAYDELFQMQELWKQHWIKGKGPSHKAINAAMEELGTLARVKNQAINDAAIARMKAEGSA